MTSRLAGAFQTMRILWVGLVVSVLLLDLVLVKLHHGGEIEHGKMPPMLPLVLAACAISTGAASFILPQRTFAAALARMTFDVVDEGGRKFVKDPSDALLKTLVVFQTPFILGMALAESVALFGFALAFQGGSTMQSAGFFGAAIVIMITKFPRLEKLKAAVEAASGAECRFEG